MKKAMCTEPCGQQREWWASHSSSSGGYTATTSYNSSDTSLMNTPKKAGMRKAPNDAIAEDQPSTHGASVLSKITPIWRWKVRQ